MDRGEASGQVPEGVEIFFAEATESQVQAALEDLKKRSDEFPDFLVRPDPSQPRQARFGEIQRERQLGELHRHFADWDERKKTNLKAWDSGSDPGQFGGEEEEGLTTSSAGKGGVPALAAQSAEEARPLQIVFLLRVVDPEPAPTADAVPDEPK